MIRTMNLFSRFFKRRTKKQDRESNVLLKWVPLTTVEQLLAIKKESAKEPILIFKHSTHCGISKMVIKRFEETLHEDLKDVKLYYLDLLQYRAISNQIAETFQVIHESPQVLIIRDGVAVKHASHYSILQLPFTDFIK